MTVFNTKGFAQKLLQKGGDEYHMHLGLHADSQSSKQQHFTSLAVLEKGQKKPPTSLYWESYSPTCWKYLWGAFFGARKSLFSASFLPGPEDDQSDGQSQCTAQVLVNELQSWPRATFHCAQTVSAKKAPRRPSCPCSVDGHTV